MAPARLDLDELYMDMDLAEIEQRISASISHEYNKMIDLHAERAAKEFGVPIAEVTPAMRHLAKQLNYYDLYGPDKGDQRRTKISDGKADDSAEGREAPGGTER